MALQFCWPISLTRPLQCATFKPNVLQLLHSGSIQSDLTSSNSVIATLYATQTQVCLDSSNTLCKQKCWNRIYTIEEFGEAAIERLRMGMLTNGSAQLPNTTDMDWKNDTDTAQQQLTRFQKTIITTGKYTISSRHHHDYVDLQWQTWLLPLLNSCFACLQHLGDVSSYRMCVCVLAFASFTGSMVGYFLLGILLIMFIVEAIRKSHRLWIEQRELSKIPSVLDEGEVCMFLLGMPLHPSVILTNRHMTVTTLHLRKKKSMTEWLRKESHWQHSKWLCYF